ncbi:MAG: hypothetical protein ACRDZ0_03685, partial [Acidimicrobiales bacterium]
MTSVDIPDVPHGVAQPAIWDAAVPLAHSVVHASADEISLCSSDAHRMGPPVSSDESKPERSRRSGRGFLQRAVAEVYDAVAESALVEERELGARVGRQRRLAPTEDDGPDEQVA